MRELKVQLRVYRCRRDRSQRAMGAKVELIVVCPQTPISRPTHPPPTHALGPRRRRYPPADATAACLRNVLIAHVGCCNYITITCRRSTGRWFGFGSNRRADVRSSMSRLAAAAAYRKRQRRLTSTAATAVAVSGLKLGHAHGRYRSISIHNVDGNNLLQVYITMIGV